MKIEQLTTTENQSIEGPLLVTPDVYGDDRGFFFESWNKRSWEELTTNNLHTLELFVQDNHSRSVKGVLRGLHYQIPPHPQGKLVSCIVGEIFDVAVDIRRTSATFQQWIGVKLSSRNHQQLWIPNGFAHGFLTLSEHAEVFYKTTDFWNRSCERAIRWDDPTLGISWPRSNLKINLSEKDRTAKLLSELGQDELFP